MNTLLTYAKRKVDNGWIVEHSDRPNAAVFATDNEGAADAFLTSRAITVFVLIWGGGMEPESPAVSVHSTKAKAIEAVRGYLKNITGLQQEQNIARQLEAGDTCVIGPHGSWFTIEAQQVDA